VKPIAIQLYTVRQACAEDFVGTLKKIAEVGYKGVEPAGLHGHDPKEIAKVVADLGMTVCSAHTSLPTKDNVSQLVDEHRTLGTKRIVTGLGPESFKTEDDCKRAADAFNEAAELIKQYEMEIGYHNHWWEFEKIDGKVPHEVMFAQTVDNVFAQLDVYWVATGGCDPVEVVGKMKGRAPLLHIKDGPLVKGEPHTAVGSGKLDMPAIIGAADPDVLDWLIVELDECATDMMDAVKESYRYLTSEGLAEGNK